MDAFDYCKQRILALCPELSPSLVESLSVGWRVAHFEKREHIIKAGEWQDEAFLVVQGLVRAYYPTVEENIVINFVSEGDFATHYHSLEHPIPSRFSFQALEPTIAVGFSYEYVQQLCRHHAEAERLLRVLVEHEYARALQHEESLLLRSAEARYKLFLQNFGSLLSRISVADLASYLGVSRQNLTIIRKRMMQ